MEPGPLPPHERTWRHPSELAPTRVDIDPGSASGSGSHVAAFAGGIVAVMAVAVLVVAMTPQPSSGPLAISASTAPMLLAANVSTTGPAASTPGPTDLVSIGAVVRPRSAPLLTSFAAFPHTVTAGPQLELDGSEIAARLPAADDMVFVRTDAVTYRLHWNQVELLAAPDGSVVFDDDGNLVAYVSDGDLIDLVAD